MKMPNLKTAAIAFAAPGLALATPVAAADFQSVAPLASAYSQTVAQTEIGTDYNRDRKRRYDRRYSRYDRDYDRDYDRRYRGRDRRYDEPVYRDTRIWRDRDGRYRCRKEDGTTGLLIGGAVGGLVGNELAGRGDRTLGAILGAAGGAILGRAIDRSNSRCR